MNIKIRQESPDDYSRVFSVVEQAFKEMEFSNGDEQHLVERLRNSDAFIPELSLVAEVDGKLVGHIMLSRMFIDDRTGKVPVLGLAPVSVLPEYQRKGIGARLIEEAHHIALGMGFSAVILVGHPDYYPRFGYQKAWAFNLKFPFEAPDEACMVFELKEGALKGVAGMVEHPKEFF